jgi:mono/diheme cytochrome c family protein
MSSRSVRIAVGGLAAMSVAGALYVVLDRLPVVDPWHAENRRADQIAIGRNLYQVHCAICHGRNLEGQPQWQRRMSNGHMPAPPHDGSGHTWHHADDVLIGITKSGLKPYAGEDYESDMPAFENTLSDADVEAIWSFVKSTWPDRQREYQRQITSQRKRVQVRGGF